MGAPAAAAAAGDEGTEADEAETLEASPDATEELISEEAIKAGGSAKDEEDTTLFLSARYPTPVAPEKPSCMCLHS